MVNVYESHDEGRTKVFLIISDDKVKSVLIGNHTHSKYMGVQFYVDDHVAEQISKCELYIDGLTPKLKVKDGETLIIPEENDEYKKRKEIEELEQRLQELKAE